MAEATSEGRVWRPVSHPRLGRKRQALVLVYTDFRSFCVMRCGFP